MARTDFEIGEVYEKNGRFFLAVSPTTVVTCINGEFKEINPYSRYEPYRGFGVSKLAEKWGIEVSALDELSKKYFTPPDCHDKHPSHRTAQRVRLRNPQKPPCSERFRAYNPQTGRPM